jgi:hypothetical protein
MPILAIGALVLILLGGGFGFLLLRKRRQVAEPTPGD